MIRNAYLDFKKWSNQDPSYIDELFSGLEQGLYRDVEILDFQPDIDTALNNQGTRIKLYRDLITVFSGNGEKNQSNLTRANMFIRNRIYNNQYAIRKEGADSLVDSVNKTRALLEQQAQKNFKSYYDKYIVAVQTKYPELTEEEQIKKATEETDLRLGKLDINNENEFQTALFYKLFNCFNAKFCQYKIGMIYFLCNPQYIPNITTNRPRIGIIPSKIIDGSLVRSVKIYAYQITIFIHNWTTRISTCGI